MKYTPSRLIVLFILTIIISACCNSQPVKMNSEPRTDTSYWSSDSLIERTGADEYGMAQYVVVFLYSGETRSQDSIEAANIQRAHLNNIKRLADEGHLVLAGPFMSGGDLRGLFIFKTKSVEEARELTQSDPAIKSGRLRAEYHAWYGSAAVNLIPELHERLATKNP